jgi:Cdc25 family phosphatase
MSEPTIATLRRISPTTLSTLLLDAQQAQAPSPLAIIDVRTSDYIGGHIATSTHVPADTLDHRIPALVRELEGKKTVVFHCALSQQRGPGAALRYLRERRKMFGTEGQEVVVLDGGFVEWQER